MFSGIWLVGTLIKEPTHLSERVGDDIPGVVVWSCFTGAGAGLGRWKGTGCPIVLSPEHCTNLEIQIQNTVLSLVMSEFNCCACLKPSGVQYLRHFTRVFPTASYFRDWRFAPLIKLCYVVTPHLHWTVMFATKNGFSQQNVIFIPFAFCEVSFHSSHIFWIFHLWSQGSCTLFSLMKHDKITFSEEIKTF